MSTTTKVGHGLAKVLGIKLDQNSDPTTRGESVFSVSSADTYVETEPTIWEWISEHAPTGRDILLYLRNLFPFTRWITRYNLQWFFGDLVAGMYHFHSEIKETGLTF
jgi:sodium-independent sulfate anion transporter 11